MVKGINIFSPFRSPFKKKKKRYSDYVIDLGKLKEKGIIREPVETEIANETSPSPSTENSAEPSGLGFLGSLASASNSETGSAAKEDFIHSSTKISREIEEKVDMISDRVYKLIERVDLLEHKMSRIEKRIGISESY